MDGELDLLPAAEVLERLRGLVASYGRSHPRALFAASEAARHHVDTGHRLAPGCCREAPDQGDVRSVD